MANNNAKENLIPKPTYDELVQRCIDYFSKHPMKSPEDQNDDCQPNQFDPNIILNVYMWGSRVYGCARPDSDWDFLIVTDQSRQKDSQSRQRMPGKGIGEIEKTYPVFEDEVVNGSLIPLGNFVDMVLEHRHEVLECLFLPPDMKLKEQVPLPFELDVDVLRRTVLWESTRRFHTARNKMRSNNIFKGKKELVHAIRYVMFASQITTHGSITDYKCANEMWREILQDPSTDWEGYITKYEKILNDYKEKFKATCVMHKFYGKMETLRHGLWILRKDILKEMKTRPQDHPEPSQSSSHNNNNSDVIPHHNNEFSVVTCLKQFGLEMTVKKFSLTASRHKEFSNLVHLVSATGYPWHSSVSHTDKLLAEAVDRECQGLVLDESDQWRVVCYPFQRLYHHAEIVHNEFLTEKFSDILKWDKNSNSAIRIFEAVEGTPVAYFYYKGRWVLNTLFECGDTELPACWKDERSICKLVSLLQPPSMQQERCYLFVLSHPNHRYVIKCEEPSLTLVGVFDVTSGTRLDHIQIGVEMGVPTPREHTDQFGDFASIVEFTQTRNPFKHKGMVLSNGSFHQVMKICSTKYATVAYATDWTGVGGINMDTNMDERMMLELIRGNKVNLFLAYFPEWRQFGDSVIQKYNQMCDNLQEIYDKFSSQHHKKKDFAEAMKRKEYRPISPVLFLVWEGSFVNIREYLAVCEEKVFHQFLKEYWNLMKQ